MRKIDRTVMLFFVILFSIASFAQEATDEPSSTEDTASYRIERVVARVNDRVITSDRLYERLFRINGEQVLVQMINEMLIEDEAKAQDVEVSDNELDEQINEFKAGFEDEDGFTNWMVQQRLTEKEFRDQLRLNMLQEKVIIKANELVVTDEEVTDFFETNKENLGTPVQYKIKHIVVESQEAGEELLIALEAGADFEKLATLKSLDPQSREQGGDLGYLAAGAMVPEFEQALQNLEVGGVSGLVPTQVGFHVLKLEEKKDAVPAKFDKEMKNNLKEFIMKQKVESAIPQFMQELQNKAEITLSTGMVP